MIPKIIHYCWFGGNPLPKYARENIESWKKFFPDYEIKEWNENNFNIEIIPYTQESYKQKNYAFVSDFARYWVLYNFGGLYFDTDVEIIKSFNDIIQQGPFLGIEKGKSGIFVNPGLGMGAVKGMNFFKLMIDFYSNLDKKIEIKPYLVGKTTEFLIQSGFLRKDEIQKVKDITIYPNDYFNPLDDYTGKITITPNTHSIHYYAKSWIDNYNPLRNKYSRIWHKLKIMLEKLYGS
ncbi:MAG: glycosyl transferase [Muribaculaceae bacterium]|nr:glycosyl transferase [Muribaculaceae bacterium]